MSANNFVYIKEDRRRIKVVMRDIETGYELGDPIYVKTLREAIKAANKILAEEEVEYGIQIELFYEVD